MIILFVDMVIIRHRYRDLFSSTQLAPEWTFYLCSIIGAFASSAGISVIFTSPWTPLITKQLWVTWLVGIVVISLIAAIAVFYVGQKTIQSNVSDEEIIAEVTR